ncbi:heavy metal-associated isoprenylated plant protein 47-like [Quercus robur]|uniref:heavy metal-associated isoprenylated plant protein 47-like n=1 Tax=Quercus robur TaxID=38942 RepID=UPI0021638B53|nr:heavy metal-associated isoprenylated plant protein 47-like [Quercus robur]
MKQKIVMKVEMTCEKCRSKAMKIAAAAQGVTSVAIEGADKSLVVVIGDGVDSVSLTRSLRKKLGSATIQSLQELKAESAEKKTDPTPTFYYSQYPQYPLYHANTVAYPDQYPLYHADAVVSDQYSSNCAIM